MSSAAIQEYQVQTIDVLMLSVVVLFVGMFLTRKIRFLGQNHIPPAVTGGLIVSIGVALLDTLAGLKITFDLALRDVLLLAFFSTIGLSAKFRLLLTGGKALVILIIVSAVFLVLQDVVGVLSALLLGAHPGYGLLAGSVSLAGGHGTAIAWGEVAQEAGLEGAQEIGIAFATLGLIAGGLIGGPIAGRLINKHKLRPSQASDTRSTSSSAADDGDPWSATVKLPDVLATILALAVCIEVGSLVNRLLFEKGVLLPGFLTSLFAGIVITNLADTFKIRLNQASIDRLGEISLNLFLSMSLMSMQLVTLANALGPILLVTIMQMLVITLFVMFVIFRLMGRDYDAAVITAGFAGLGLGATPVAIANMSAITSRYGPSPKAFLIVPLIGAFFIDILNAATIKGFINVITRMLS
ncbi:MAG: sodium/glutamate symporter [Gammaproteobacteria bacterium]|nr:sodium/glutamate symporter [Gammaproteobacteria bacterium]